MSCSASENKRRLTDLLPDELLHEMTPTRAQAKAVMYATSRLNQHHLTVQAQAVIVVAPLCSTKLQLHLL